MIVENYLENKHKLMNYFEIDNDYYVYNATDYKWRVRKFDEILFLNIYKDDDKKEEYVIVKRNNNPLVCVKDEYSLFVVIDCIKVAFIVKNTSQLTDI